MSQRYSFFAQLMGLLALGLGGAVATAAANEQATLPEQVTLPAPSVDQLVGAHTVEAVDVRALKRASRVLEDLFQDELNDLNA